jgi:hypothetical protein
VLAFQSGGYEAGPRPAVVPEPSVSWLVLVSVAAFARRRALKCSLSAQPTPLARPNEKPRGLPKGGHRTT